MEDVTNPEYWAKRVRECGGDLQRAMFTGDPDEFGRVHKAQMVAVQRADIKPTDSVLDVGCGYGRLLHVLGVDRSGIYVGVDLSPDFVRVARAIYQGRIFDIVDFGGPEGDRYCRYLESCHYKYDVAMAVWVKSMLERNGRADVWERIHANMVRVARRVVVIH